MKVPASIRRIYDDQLATNQRLRSHVDEKFKGIRRPRWHYESRLKEAQSFALKIESGRFGDPAALEDFFACTLVVANANEVSAAEELVREKFEFVRRRPKEASWTHKQSSDFPFDDLRLYVRVGESEQAAPKDFAGVVFEIQIKTFLQHAWSIATHDLVYKTKDVDWSKERIAYQIKAMLEHAEVSISEAQQLATSSLLAKEDRRTRSLRLGIALLRAQWEQDDLPADVHRLAENLADLIGVLKVDLTRIEQILERGKATGAGKHPSNLSPYATVVQYLLVQERDRILAYLRATNGKLKVLIPAELTLPAGTDPTMLPNAVFVPAN